MTLNKDKNNKFTFDNGNGILRHALNLDEVIDTLLHIYKYKAFEVNEALTSMIKNGHDVIEFGDLQGKFLYSKKGK